jgi:uncharacterized membrane protein AbrB (regulator of aidB expression)
VPILREFSGMVLTIAVALLSGIAMKVMGAPAPFLFGSLIGVWIFGACVKPLSGYLGFPRWLYIPVTLGLGVLVGSMFNPGVLASIASWWDTVAAMIGATLLASFAGYAITRKTWHYCAVCRAVRRNCWQSAAGLWRRTMWWRYVTWCEWRWFFA